MLSRQELAALGFALEVAKSESRRNGDLFAVQLADLRRLATTATQLVVRHDLAATTTSTTDLEASWQTMYPMTVADIAKTRPCSPQYVTKLARDGRLPGVKIGGRWRFCEPEGPETQR